MASMERRPEESRPLAAGWQRVAVTSLAALIMLELLWEMWLAPLRPGGTWLALKALPLAILWPGAARGAKRAGQWLSLLLPLYAAEAVVRGATAHGRLAIVAWTVVIVAALTFFALLAAIRGGRRQVP